MYNNDDNSIQVKTTLTVPGKSILLALLAAIALGACSPLDLLNGAVSANALRPSLDVPYGTHPRHRLDIYAPNSPSDGARTVVVFFYGGRWRSGSRTDYLFVAESLGQADVLTVIPDVRLYPEVRFPDFLDDAADAVQWVRRNIDRYGGDPSSIYLAGHSSGAHIAIMLALDESRLDPAGIRGAVGIAGPYDFLPYHSDELTDIFSGASDPRDTQPIHFVDGDEPPVLLISGSDDRIVDPGNTRRLEARIAERGGDVRTVFYDGTGHYAIIAAMARPLRSIAPTLRDVLAFIGSGRG